EATLVAHPDFVNHLVLARHDALDDGAATGAGLAARVQGGVAAHRAVGADAGNGRHFPGTGAKAEIDAGEGAHGADVGGVAAENAVKTGVGVGDDFQAAPTLVEGDDRVVDQLVLVADTARTLDAALAVE